MFRVNMITIIAYNILTAVLLSSHNSFILSDNAKIQKIPAQERYLKSFIIIFRMIGDSGDICVYFIVAQGITLAVIL